LAKATAERHIRTIEAINKDRGAAAKAYVEAVGEARNKLVDARRGNRLAWFKSVVVLYETEIVVKDLARSLGADVKARVEETGTVTKTQGWVSKETVDSRASYLYLDCKDWAEVIGMPMAGSGYQFGTRASAAGGGIRRFEQEVNQAARNADAVRARLAPLVALAENSLAEVERSVPSALAEADSELAKAAEIAIAELSKIRSASTKTPRAVERAIELAQAARAAAGEADATVAEADALKAVHSGLSWLDRSAAKDATKHLAAAMEVGESIEEVAAGKIDKKNALVALTNRRLIVASPTGVRAWRMGPAISTELVERFSISEVTWRVGTEVVVAGISRDRARQIATACRVSCTPTPDPVVMDEQEVPDEQEEIIDGELLDPSEGSSTSANPIDLLERLAALRNVGALSAEEFEAKKTELLGRL